MMLPKVHTSVATTEAALFFLLLLSFEFIAASEREREC